MTHPDSQSGTRPEHQASTLDAGHFAVLLEECYGRLWVLAAAILGDRHQAEDMVQESAVVALTRLDQFKPGTNFAAWMSKIVRWQAFNASRKRQRRKTHPVAPEKLELQPETQAAPDALPDPWQPDLGHQDHFDDAVMNALSDIGEVARACLLLKTVHELSYAEIAEALEIPEGTAMSHVHRAKAQLRHRLASQFAPASRESNQE